VVVWELCTGEPPVRGELRELRAPDECPAQMAALVRRCLDADPDARPAAAEVLQLLEVL
jgi:hypothetical protein